MNWLITGGCGFLGKNLIKFLLSEKNDVSIRVIDNFSVGKLDDLAYATQDYKLVDQLEGLTWDNNFVQVLKGDILDAQLAIDVTNGADVIVHLAANTGVGPSVENPRMDCTTNVLGVFNYLEACRSNDISRFVFASSGAPIGECIPPIHEELACHPVSPYGASKLAGEAYCSAYFRSYGVNTVALRFGNVFGPGSTHKSSVVAKFIRKAMNRETLEIYGSGSQTRDFIYTEDLVRAIWLAATKDGVGGEIFQIATNHETTVTELTQKLIQTLDEFGIKDILVVNGAKRIGDVMRNFSDTSKAKRMLGFECMSDLNSGMRETVRWFVNHESLK